MKTFGVVILTALSLQGSQVRAEFMEVTATQIVSVAAIKDANPSILVQWDLPEDLDSLIIDAAVITMTVPVDGDEPMELDAHRMVKSWDAREVGSSGNWPNGEKVYDEEISSPAIVTKENEGKISIDVYLPVLDHIADKTSNFGFILVPEENGTSKIHRIEANAPATLAGAKLIIAYRTPR